MLRPAPLRVVRFVLHHPWSLRSMLLPPTDLSAGEAYVYGHVDLGNDLLRLFLDEDLVYSAAVFADPDEPLATAQHREFEGSFAAVVSVGLFEHVGPDRFASYLRQHDVFPDGGQLRADHALTLRHWIRRPESNHDEAVRVASETDYRIWRAYMAGSVVGSESGELGDVQILGSRPGGGAAAADPTAAVPELVDLRPVDDR